MEQARKNIEILKLKDLQHREIILLVMVQTEAAASAQRAATTVPASHVTAAYNLTINSTSTNKSETVSVPITSSAGYVAGLINAKANSLGVEARAITRGKITLLYC